MQEQRRALIIVLRNRALSIVRQRTASFKPPPKRAIFGPLRPQCAPSVRCLWLLGYIQRCGVTTAAKIRYEFGVSHRSYRRDIDRLRSAGFLIFCERNGKEHLIRYGGFDETYAEAVRDRSTLNYLGNHQRCERRPRPTGSTLPPNYYGTALQNQ